MATRKTVPPATTQDELDDKSKVTDVEFNESEQEQETDDQAVARVCSELSDDDQAMVYIYREGKSAKERVYIDEMPPGEFRLQMLKDEPYNGGTFRIYVRGSGDSGFRANRKITVEPRPRKPEPPAASTAPASDAIANALAQMQQQNAQMMKDMVNMMQASRVPQSSPIDMLTQLKLLKELMPAPVPVSVQQPAFDPTAMFAQFMDMFKTVSAMANGGGELGVTDLIARGIDAFKPLAEIAAQQRQALSHPATVAPALNATPAPSAQPEEIDQDMMMLTFYFGQLIDKAAADADPGIYADLILDNASDAMIQDYLAPDDWMARLASIDARVHQYPGWFKNLRDLIITTWTQLNAAVTTDTDSGQQETLTNNHVHPAGSTDPDPRTHS